MQRTDSFEKTLMLGKIEGERRRGWQRMKWLDGITDSTWVWVNFGSWWWTGRPGVLQQMGSQRLRHDWATDLNWTQSDSCFVFFFPNWKMWHYSTSSFLLSFQTLVNTLSGWPYHRNFLTSCFKLSSCFSQWGHSAQGHENLQPWDLFLETWVERSFYWESAGWECHRQLDLHGMGLDSQLAAHMSQDLMGCGARKGEWLE